MVIAGLALILSAGAASSSDLPLGGYSEITAPELKELTDSGREVLIINVLSKIEFDIQHISGSINIPIDKMATTDKLPEDKSMPLVFHCLSER